MYPSTIMASIKSFQIPGTDNYKASHLLCYLARGEEGLTAQNACHNTLKASINKFPDLQELLEDNYKKTPVVSSEKFEDFIIFLEAHGSGIKLCIFSF